MAIGVGLFASVMATWEPNERFTYGYAIPSMSSTSGNQSSSYGRIETLSGFANGIFLILISIFIVFEAIQRMYVVARWFVGRLSNGRLTKSGSARDAYRSTPTRKLFGISGKSFWDVRHGRTSSCNFLSY
jgi:Cation efflux family